MFIAAFVADFWNDHGGTDWYLCHPGLLGYCAALPNGAGKAGECCDPFLRARHTLIILLKKMSNPSLPFAEKKFIEIKGHRMAYIDEGEGAPIVFQHGNPTSSYLWRNVMPACRGLGRLIACDLIGMGDSDKLPNSGADCYTYAEQRSFLFALWEELKLEKDVVLVLHDWGSVLGFDWANQNRSRVQGIVMGIPVQSKPLASAASAALG